MATSFRLSVSIPILLIFLSTLYQFSSSATTLHTPLSSYSSSHRNLLALRRNRSRIPSCSEMVSRSQCSQNPSCRWCRSEAIDDSCFTKIEAWRLPLQVFACDS